MSPTIIANARYALIAFLALCSGNALAIWVAVQDTPDYIAYADPETVSREGDIVQMRDLVDLKAPRSSPLGTQHSSSVAHSEFDCKNERMRTLNFALHSGQMGYGDIVETPSMSRQWLPATAGTLLKALWHFACNR